MHFHTLVLWLKDIGAHTRAKGIECAHPLDRALVFCHLFEQISFSMDANNSIRLIHADRIRPYPLCQAMSPPGELPGLANTPLGVNLQTSEQIVDYFGPHVLRIVDQHSAFAWRRMLL